MDIASELDAICRSLDIPLIFKASFDKANRTSGQAGRGVGMDKGLDILSSVRADTGLPVLTDIHLPGQAAEVAAVADVLQIPAFLCRQTDLIEAAAATGRPLNIKKGQFLAPDDMRNVVEESARRRRAGSAHLRARQLCFGYHNLVVDMRGLLWMRETGCPIVFDATHSAQLPGGGGDKTAGVREVIPALARGGGGGWRSRPVYRDAPATGERHFRRGHAAALVRDGGITAVLDRPCPRRPALKRTPGKGGWRRRQYPTGRKDR